MVIRNIVPKSLWRVSSVSTALSSLLFSRVTHRSDSTAARDTSTLPRASAAASGLGAGMAIGIVGDAAVRAVERQDKLYVGMILILIFAEALALYGLIVALILTQ